MKISNRIVWCLALTGLASFPLLAQEPQAEEEPVATYEDVLFVEESLPYVPDSNTVATKIPVPLRQTPASVGVVSAPMMKEQGATVLGDALRNVSGVNVQTQSGVADYFVVRGFDSIANGLVMVDGAPEPEISFYQLYNIERVEVLKGPGGFLYGANPIAATVNMVREQPEPGRSFFELGVSGGSYGTYGGTLDWNAGSGDGPFAFRLNGLWQESDGYRDETPSDIQAINPSFSWRTGENSLLNVNLEFIDSSFTPDAGLPIVTTFEFRPPFPFPIPSGQEIADVERTRSYRSPFDRSEQETRRAQVDYENALSDRLTLRNKTYYRELQWLSDGTIINGVLPGFAVGAPDDQVIRTLVLLDDTQEFFGNQLEAVYSLETGSVKHQILGGVEIGRFDDQFTLDFGLLPTIGLNNPVETAQGFQRSRTRRRTPRPR